MNEIVLLESLLKIKDPIITSGGLRLDYPPHKVLRCGNTKCELKDSCIHYLLGKSSSKDCCIRHESFIDAGRWKKYGRRLGDPESLSESEYIEVLELILRYYERS